MDSVLVIILVVVAVLAVGVAVVLGSLDRFQGWRRNETQPPEEEHLDAQGTVSDVLEDKRDR
jgi:hypothetical protein